MLRLRMKFAPSLGLRTPCPMGCEGGLQTTVSIGLYNVQDFFVRLASYKLREEILIIVLLISIILVIYFLVYSISISDSPVIQGINENIAVR